MFKKFVAFTFIFVVSFELPAKNVLTVTNLTNEQLVLDGNKELHLTASSNIFTNSSINLTSENAWLFFDQVKPSVVISSYQSNIKINSANLIPDVNARVCSYINGTVIVPHPAGFSPLIGYTEKNFAGTPVTFTTEVYYTDQPGAYVPASLKRPLGMSPVTSIGEIVSDEQKITGFVSGNYLYLKNVPAKSDVSIYNALGVLVTRISDYENNAGIALEDRGLYLAVIKSGSKKQSLKIMH